MNYARKWHEAGSKITRSRIENGTNQARKWHKLGSKMARTRHEKSSNQARNQHEKSSNSSQFKARSWARKMARTKA